MTTQRWLAVRLDVLATILTLFVSLLAVLVQFTISPALVGLVLSYMVGVQRGSVSLVRQKLMLTAKHRGFRLVSAAECR
jgi:hypothetical protein